MSIYCGYYAYANPDPEHCYYVIGVDKVNQSVDAMRDAANEKGVTLRKGYPFDVASLFRTYFVWGFWNIVAQLVVVITSTLIYQCRPDLALFQLFSFTAAIMCSNLFHFFLGILWRFSKVGKTVSGEFLAKEADK